jgi:polysaccharide biosynthesis protein PslG
VRSGIPRTARPFMSTVLALMLLLGVGGASAAPQAGAQFPDTEVGVQWHALWADQTEESRVRELDVVAANGARWVRIDVGWSMIQPRAGSYDLDWGVPFVESTIDKARARGLKVLVTFWRTPGWANGGRGPTTPPDNPQDYANALGWLVNRLQDRVSAWEIWNEPNLNDYFTGASPTAYVGLLQPAYRAAHAADPDSVVVFGGTVYVDTDWIASAYEAGARGHFDAMAVHPYQGRADEPPESPDTGDRARMMHVDVLVNLMRSKGDEAKPIMFTEFGWSVHDNTSSTPVWERGVTEHQQSDYFARTLALVRSRWPQVTVLIWYTSRDKDTGAIHTDHRGLMERAFAPRPILSEFKAHSKVPLTGPDAGGPVSGTVQLAVEWRTSGRIARARPTVVLHRASASAGASVDVKMRCYTAAGKRVKGKACRIRVKSNARARVTIKACRIRSVLVRARVIEAGASGASQIDIRRFRIKGCRGS